MPSFHEREPFDPTVDEPLISGYEGSGISILDGRRSVGRKFGVMHDDGAGLKTPFTASVGCDRLTEPKAASRSQFLQLRVRGFQG